MMDPLQVARRDLLEPAELSEAALEAVLGDVLGTGVDYADLYLQFSRRESWVLEDRIVREGSFSLDRGLGVRVTVGE